MSFNLWGRKKLNPPSRAVAETKDLSEKAGITQVQHGAAQALSQPTDVATSPHAEYGGDVFSVKLFSRSRH